MNEHTFVLCVCILTVLAHISLLWQRGWLIGECRREQTKMKTKWDDWKAEQEQWRKDFEESHKSPWLTGEPKKHTA